MKSTAHGILSDMDIEELVTLKDCISTNLTHDLNQYQRRLPTGDENLDWVRREVDDYIVKQIIGDRLDTIKYIVRRIEGHGRKSSLPVTQDMIERANAYPIRDLYVGDAPARGLVRCPFHPDATASLSFNKYNRFKCFGCDAKGSAIDFYMRLHNVKFVEAVRALCG